MRLLIITQKVDERDDNLGFFHRWIEEFAKQCESVIVICLYEGAHRLPHTVRVFSLGKESGVSRIKYLKRFYTFIWRERKNYDGVFIHMNQIYAILGGCLWKMMGKRVGMWYAHGTVSWSLRLATFFVDRVFTSTESGFRITSPKKRVVGQGIDVHAFALKKSYEIGTIFKLVTFGRITPAKGIETMIDVLVLLFEQGINVSLDIMGSGDASYVEQLNTYARSRHIQDRIIFKGGMPYDVLIKSIGEYDAFLNFGKTGSLDKAILDAVAAGLPVVTTNLAIRTIDDSNGDPGIIVTDAPQDALALLWRETPLVRKMRADHAYARVLDHSLGSLVSKLISEMSVCALHYSDR